MSNKRKISTVVILILLAVLNYLIFTGYQVSIENRTVDIRISMTSDEGQDIQLFYLLESDSGETGFSESQMLTAEYEDVDEEQTLTFSVPGNVRALRLDFSDALDTETEISSLEISFKDQTISASDEELEELLYQNGIEDLAVGGGIRVETQAGDPYIAWDVSGWGVSQMVESQNVVRSTLIRVLLCAGLDLVFAIALCFPKVLWSLPKELAENRKLIFSLSKNDFKTKFAGSYLGIFWAFVQPIVTVVLYWFVFEKGLKAGGINTKAGIEVPFVLWLIAGLVPWFLFQDTLNGGTNSLIEYSYLVKKVVFKISILPIIKIISALFVHVFFVAFMLVMYVVMGYGLHISYIQIIYYSVCVLALSIGLSYATSAITVFFRDLTQVINIVLQVGTWLTPIMWNFESIGMPQALKFVFMLNPMYYVVAGYRSALIDQTGFWQMPVLSCYFWGLVVICFVVGSTIFRRLQVHFADML